MPWCLGCNSTWRRRWQKFCWEMVLRSHSSKCQKIWCDWSRLNCQSQWTFILCTWGQRLLSRLVQIIVLDIWCLDFCQKGGCQCFDDFISFIRKIKDPMEAAQEVAQRSLERSSLSHSPQRWMAVPFPPSSLPCIQPRSCSTTSRVCHFSADRGATSVTTWIKWLSGFGKILEKRKTKWSQMACSKSHVLLDCIFL